MKKWTAAIAIVIMVLAPITTANAARRHHTVPGEVGVLTGVDLGKHRRGADAYVSGWFDFDTEGDAIEALAFKHPSVPQPIMIVGNNPGFTEFNPGLDDSWSNLSNILPDGGYEILVRQDGLIVSHAFTINKSLMPALPNITYPADGQVISSLPLVVTWDTVPVGVHGVELWVESNDDPIVGVEFDVSLAPGQTSYEIPAALLAPGRTYEIGIAFEVFEPGIGYFSERSIVITTASP